MKNLMKPVTIKMLSLIAIVSLTHIVEAQNIYKDKLAHTFSIVARDKVTGEMAVGVQSHWFSVGTLVSWGKSGVGVVATQSFVNPEFGPDGLELMAEGKKAEETLQLLISEDEGKEFRQVACLDASGNVSAFTGKKCIASASHISGDNYAVQANMMLNDKVVPAMAKAFEENEDLPLEERVLKVLIAAQKAGGDIRGKQSAVLIVVHAEPTEKSWLDKKIDLRVDDHEQPLIELQRLLKVHKAYDHMNRGDFAMETGDMKKAMKEYSEAEQLLPENLEIRYWKAITMANNDQLQEALPILKDIFNTDENWRELTRRLPKSGLLNLPESDLKMIIEL
jgi:uncharacterized Ntn-hydrolase superfamily protein